MRGNSVHGERQEIAKIMVFSFMFGIIFGMALMSLILGILFLLRIKGDDHPLTIEEIRERLSEIWNDER